MIKAIASGSKIYLYFVTSRILPHLNSKIVKTNYIPLDTYWVLKPTQLPSEILLPKRIICCSITTACPTVEEIIHELSKDIRMFHLHRQSFSCIPDKDIRVFHLDR